MYKRQTPILKNRITDIHFDKSNNVLWVGTFGRGLLKLNLKGNDINRIPVSYTHLLRITERC